jgi:hypothetical protein
MDIIQRMPNEHLALVIRGKMKGRKTRHRVLIADPPSSTGSLRAPDHRVEMRKTFQRWATDCLPIIRLVIDLGLVKRSLGLMFTMLECVDCPRKTLYLGNEETELFKSHLLLSSHFLLSNKYVNLS